jgi:organic radical activating enzyme
MAKNTITKAFPDPNGSLLVNSVFMTLQGEGPDAGKPAIFVRLSKCNLSCWFCDTEFETGERMQLPEILDAVLKLAKKHVCALVVITGGEPLLQNIIPLVDILNVHGIAVSVETAGTVYLEHLDKYFAPTREINGNVIVCSPKTPTVNPELVPLVGAWKYVVRANGCDAQGIPVTSTQTPDGKQRPLFRDRCGTPIYLQPMDEGVAVLNDANTVYAAEMCIKHGYRLSIQIHKIAGVA